MQGQLPGRRRCHVRFNGRWLDHVVWADTRAGWAAVIVVNEKGKILTEKQSLRIREIWGSIELWLQPESTGRRRVEDRERFTELPAYEPEYLEYYSIDESGLRRVSPKAGTGLLGDHRMTVWGGTTPAGARPWQHPPLL